MSYAVDDILPAEPNGEVVHWMDPRPSSFRPTAPTVTAFAVGLAVAAVGIALFQYLAPRREGLPPWRWRRGSVH